MNQNPASASPQNNVSLLMGSVAMPQMSNFSQHDPQWLLRKQRPTSFGSRKNRPGKTWSINEEKTLGVETPQEFLDKHVIKILSSDPTGVGQEFLKQLKDGANSVEPAAS